MEKHLVELTAKILGEDPKQVAEIIDFNEKFIADTIRSGELKNVRVPLFGVFKVNLKRMHNLIMDQSSPKVIEQKSTQ